MENGKIYVKLPTGEFRACNEHEDPFCKILDEMKSLYEKKNSDYGNSFAETIQEFGFKPAIARINDKLKRVKNIVNGQKMFIDESMRDNLIDIAVYTVLTLIELDNDTTIAK